MDVVPHSSNNMILGKPKDMDNCISIPATMLLSEEDGKRVQTIATFWKPTQAELELLMANGTVALWVWGEWHPPVWITVEESK
jgi:hypothetical protein